MKKDEKETKKKSKNEENYESAITCARTGFVLNSVNVVIALFTYVLLGIRKEVEVPNIIIVSITLLFAFMFSFFSALKKTKTDSTVASVFEAALVCEVITFILLGNHWVQFLVGCFALITLLFQLSASRGLKD